MSTSDENADGVLETFFAADLEYDSRGRLVQSTASLDAPVDGTADHLTAVAVGYDSRSNEVLRVTEDDFGADGTIDSRLTSSRVFDRNGHETGATHESDLDADGAIDTRIALTLEYDQRGRLVLLTTAVDQGADGVLEHTEIVSIRYEGAPRNGFSDQPAAELRLEFRAAAPNPFRDRTALGFTLPVAARVELAIYDMSGRLVRTLASGAVDAGEHEVVWDGGDARGRAVPAGAYFARLRAGDLETTRRVIRMP